MMVLTKEIISELEWLLGDARQSTDLPKLQIMRIRKKGFVNHAAVIRSVFHLNEVNYDLDQ
jgi:hypothetical protein